MPKVLKISYNSYTLCVGAVKGLVGRVFPARRAAVCAEPRRAEDRRALPPVNVVWRVARFRNLSSI